MNELWSNTNLDLKRGFIDSLLYRHLLTKWNNKLFLKDICCLNVQQKKW